MLYKRHNTYRDQGKENEVNRFKNTSSSFFKVPLKLLSDDYACIMYVFF